MNSLVYWAIVAHLCGDYCFQTSYMALNKYRNKLACLCHVIAYTACFWPITKDWGDLLFIAGTHFVIDHYRLPALHAAILNHNWELLRDRRWITDAPKIPPFVVLAIDQTYHLICNGIALLN